MNKSKTILLMLILACYLFLLVGCSDDSSDHKMLSIHDRDGNVIYIGMDRNSAEQIFGEPHDTFGGGYTYRHNDGQIVIVYRDNSIVLVSIQGSDIGWTTSRGADIGVTTLSELYELYTPYLFSNYTSPIIFFDNYMNPIYIENQEHFDEIVTNGLHEYILSFLVRVDNEILNVITFGDRIASITLR